MIYRVEIDGSLLESEQQQSTLSDVHLELFRNNKADGLGIFNFGLLRATDRQNGDFLGGIVLQHTFEFLPEGMQARGFPVNERLDMIEPPSRQTWLIFQEQEPVRVASKPSHPFSRPRRIFNCILDGIDKVDFGFGNHNRVEE